MTYEERETSQFGGEPVECYRFALGAQTWLFTSADREITLPAGVFTPEVISRGEQDHSQEDAGGKIEVHLARTNPVAKPFISFVPTSTLYVSIYRAHRGDEAAAIAFFVGRVTGARFQDSEAILTCSPISHTLGRRFPVLGYHAQCNWALYSAPCGVSKAAYRDDVVVTTVEGDDIVSNDFSLRPDGWFTNGWIERADGDVRFIVDHVGNRVTLMNPFADLESLEEVGAYAGCDRLAPTCDTKFGNLARHLGFSWIPKRNPHEGRIG